MSKDLQQKNLKFKNGIAILKDELLRARAELENYRKRAEKEKQESLLYANTQLIYHLLPVLDNFSRATFHSNEIEEKYANWVGGILAIKKQLEDALKQEGLEKIPVNSGDEFDPKIHEAISHEKSTLEENKIAYEIEPGYKFREKMLRPAKVLVSSGNK